MNIGKIGAFNTKSNVMPFRAGNNSGKTEYENPVNRETEKNLAILSSFAASAVTGALIGCLSSLATKKGSKSPYWIGIAGGLGCLAVTLPSAIYNRKVSAFVKQKEVDVFSRDRNLKSNLLEEVDKEVQNPEVSLDKKLDDNLKLQMANRGAAVGLANITPKA